MIDARRVVSLVFLTCVFGCGPDPVVPDPGVDPNSIALDRRYELSSCSPADCHDYHPHGNGFVDSVRLVLRPDRTADFTYMASGTEDPCYLSGGGCSRPYWTVWRLSGTYRFAGKRLYIDYTPVDHIFLSGNFPAFVPASWTGPDSLMYTCDYCTARYNLRPR